MDSELIIILRGAFNKYVECMVIITASRRITQIEPRKMFGEGPQKMFGAGHRTFGAGHRTFGAGPRQFVHREHSAFVLPA